MIESLLPNLCDAIWNIHRGQFTAIIESLLPDVCDAVRDLNGCQIAAIRKSAPTNTGNTIWNVDRC